MCVTCLSGARARNTRNARLSLRAGVTVSCLSCLRGRGWPDHRVSPLRLSVGSVPSPLVLSHTQAPVERTHPDISAATRQHTAQLSFGDITPAFISNKRKCCSIYPRGKYLIGIDVKGSSYHALAGKSYSFSLFMLRQFVTFFSHDIPNLSGCQSVRCRPSARLEMSNL